MKLYDDLQKTRDEIKSITVATNDLAVAYRDLPDDACRQRRIMYALHAGLACQLYMAKRREAYIQRELGL